METGSKDEREAAHAAYIQHVRLSLKSGLAPEPIERYLHEWASVRKVSLPVYEEPDSHTARDYSGNYGGRGVGREQI